MIVKRRIKPKPKPKKYSGLLRDTIQDRARRAYRLRRPDFELTTCLRSLRYFEGKAHFLPTSIEGDNTIVNLPVYKITEVAELLEKSYQTFWRWTSRDAIVPPPVLTTHGQGRSTNVYHREEVRALITIIGEHEKEFSYYRADHTMTRKKLFDAIEKIRSQLQQEFTNAKEKNSRPPVRLRRRVSRD